MMGNDRAADRSGEIIAMEWSVRVVRTGQGILRKHLLIVKVVAGQAVELIRARLRSLRHLKATAATVFHRKCVDLNIHFLDEIGVGSEIQHALANSAGDIEPVHDPHIRNRALAVDADIHCLFRRIIVDAGARCP